MSIFSNNDLQVLKNINNSYIVGRTTKYTSVDGQGTWYQFIQHSNPASDRLYKNLNNIFNGNYTISISGGSGNWQFMLQYIDINDPNTPHNDQWTTSKTFDLDFNNRRYGLAIKRGNNNRILPEYFENDGITITVQMNTGLGAGIEMSTHEVIINNNSTNDKNYSYGTGKRHAGAAIFDALYSMHQPTHYGWKTGWYDESSDADNSTSTQNCRLVFGIIPMFWSNGSSNCTINDGHKDIISESGAAHPYRNKIKLQNNPDGGSSTYNSDIAKFASAVGFSINPTTISATDPSISKLDFDIRYYKVLNGIYDTETAGKVTTITDVIDFEMLIIEHAIGIGAKKECNNYKCIEPKGKPATVVNRRYNPGYKWWSLERDKYKWLSLEKSVCLRLGCIPKKIYTNYVQRDTYTIENEMTYGYYRSSSDNIVNPPDGRTLDEQYSGVYDLKKRTVEIYDDPNAGDPYNPGNTLTRNDDTTWNEYINIRPDIIEDEMFFGGKTVFTNNNYHVDPNTNMIIPDTDVICPYKHTLNYILETIYSANVNNGILNDVLFYTLDNEQNYGEFPIHDMFNYSTIPYATSYSNSSSSYPYSVMNIVPVFAESISHASQYSPSPQCCIINTFQSIVYNALYKNPISNSTLSYDKTDTDLKNKSIPTFSGEGQDYTEDFLKKENQIKGTYKKYENFSMKYDPAQGIYVSYAIRVRTDSNGNLTGFSDGPTCVTLNEWIAWINGNIYVIPEDLFDCYVYWSSDDFEALDDFFNTGVTVSGVHPLTLQNAKANGIQNLTAYGDCSQSGTPTPTSPVPIVCNNGAIKARHQSGLPLGYTLLDYIESTGTQYIDTEIKPTTTTEVNLVGQFTNDTTNTQNFFGSRNIASAGVGSWNLFYNVSGSKQIRPDWATTQRYSFSKNTDFNIVLSCDNNGRGVFTINGAQPFLPTGNAKEDGLYNMVLFGCNTAGTTSGAPLMLKSCSIKKNGVLVRNFIPARRNADSVLGMYDLVTDAFFTNAGTGTFIAGNTVSDLIEIYADGTKETISLNGSNVSTCANLLKIGTYQDTQEIISGIITRNVGIKVLDGTENWRKASAGNLFYTQIYDVPVFSGVEESLVTHYSYNGSANAQMPDETFKFANAGAFGGNACLHVRDFSHNNDTNTFKVWLATQYTSGTPVIIIYPLAAPTPDSASPQSIANPSGTNTLDIAQASLPNLELSCTYKRKR